MHGAKTIVIVPVPGGMDELRKGFGALLHEQPGDGPVGLALVEVVGKNEAVDYLVSYGIAN